MVDRKEIGHDGRLVVAGQDVPVTNITYDDSADVSETQFNDALHQDIVFTGVNFSGSFEYDGSNEELRQLIRTQASDGKYDVPVNPRDLEIHVEESERTVIFKNCIVETRSRDRPSDDRVSTSCDFVAERQFHK